MLYSGSTIDVPLIFISGAQDWGMYQSPGALEAMQRRSCSDFRGVYVIPEAGHWVQQEQSTAVVSVLMDFFQS